MKLILGSQSVGRKRILESMGYTFEVMNPDIDEKSIRCDDPAKLTLALAHAKADALIARIGEPAKLITSDQVVWCNGKIFEKPANREEAFHFFEMYACHPAETVTSVVVANLETGWRASGTDVAKIFLKPVPKEIIQKYIDTGDPFMSAGGFDIDHPLIAPYVDRIEGEYESIIGLPKKLTQDLLRLA